MNKKGSVLIFLLLITGVISFFLMQTLYYAKLNQKLCYNYNKNFLLEQNFKKISFLFSELIKNKSLYSDYFEDDIFKTFEKGYNIKIDNKKFNVVLKKESDLIDINGKNEALIKKAVIKSVDENENYDEIKVEQVVDSILDWIDSDDLKRVNGAEKESYEKFGYTPANSPLKDIFELKKIKNIDEDTFFRVEKDQDNNISYKGLLTFFTVYKRGYPKYEPFLMKKFYYKNVLRLYLRPDNSKKIYILFLGEKGNGFKLLKWKRLI